MLLLPDGGFGGKADKYTYDLLDYIQHQALSDGAAAIIQNTALLENPLAPTSLSD